MFHQDLRELERHHPQYQSKKGSYKKGHAIEGSIRAKNLSMSFDYRFVVGSHIS